MRSVAYSAAAQRDLASITEYVTRESGNAAVGERFAAELADKCLQLASLPGTLGRPRHELRPDLRSFAFRNYVIFFRYDRDVFYVVNVLHGQRDLAAYFGDDG